MIKTFFSFLQFYLRNKGVLHISENMQKLYDWRKPVKPYAFIRLHNEIKTVDACLHSILPILKGGVIGFNSCTDGTKEYILEFCKKYPQFIPAEYPHYLIPANDKRYKEDNIDINSRLDTYYNFVWSKLPQNEWIIKIDGDHIWDLENTIKLCKLVIRKKDCVILNRINLHCVNEQVYIHKKVPLFEPGDSWLLYNDGKINFTFRRGWNDNEFFAWECLELPRKERRKIYGILSNYHFPLVKSHRSNFNTEDWVLLQDYDLQKYIIENNMQGRVPDDMISTERIIAEFKKFNHEKE